MYGSTLGLRCEGVEGRGVVALGVRGGGGGGRVEQHRPLMSRHLSLHKNFFLRDANSMAFKDMGFHSSKSFISVHTQGLVLN